MAVERVVYRPRDAERGVLHAVVRAHLETFLREATHRGDGTGLSQFVEQEFREFLTCGVLAHGFARLRCDTCAEERLVPFSCKGRGYAEWWNMRGTEVPSAATAKRAGVMSLVRGVRDFA